MLELVVKLGERDALRATLLRGMRETPVLLMPAFGVTAFPHRQRVFATPQGDITLMEAIRLVSPWNLFGMPSMTVPVSFDADGMPAAVQFVGLPWSEETLLDLAVGFEATRGPFPSPPLSGPV